ncbi:MAG: hypothetical protein EXR69_00065 [Myxococcales bacterium]|nr:hypothetical protein [Myxococcales bacterium]
MALLAMGTGACAGHHGVRSGPPPLSDLPASVASDGLTPTPAADKGLYSELAIDGPLASRVSTSPADLVIFYGSEQRGSMETCGCPHRPRGSLARTESYVQAAARSSPYSLLVNAGEWLTDAVGFQNMPLPQLAVMDRTAAKGFIQGGWDALNVTPRDLAGLSAVDPEDLARLPMVSANIEGPGIRRSIELRTADGWFLVTGIAAPEATPSDHAGYTVHPPEDALPFLQQQAERAIDGIILLQYNATDAAKMLARRVPRIIAVIDGGDHNQYVEPFYVNRAVWVFSFVQTMRLGELRLTFAPDGSVATGLDRHIDLDPGIPDDPVLRAMQEEARRAIDAALRP